MSTPEAPDRKTTLRKARRLEGCVMMVGPEKDAKTQKYVIAKVFSILCDNQYCSCKLAERKDGFSPAGL